jgi:hypothetical protein
MAVIVRGKSLLAAPETGVTESFVTGPFVADSSVRGGGVDI